MRFILVDDEPLATKQLEMIIRKCAPDDGVDSINDEEEALELVKKNKYDAAFLDIEMPKINGLTLAREIRKLDPEVQIVFITANQQYALDAFTMRVNGYIMKPATVEKVQKELDFINRIDKGGLVHIVTFGGFDVMIDGGPLKFSRGKAKELLALLVDKRGVSINSAVACASLWPDAIDDDSLKSNFRNIVASLRKTLDEAGIADIFIKEQNSFAVDVDKIDCDYFDFLNGDVLTINKYNGNYMPEYEWAEMTTVHLDDLSVRVHDINENEEKELYKLNERRGAARSIYKTECKVLCEESGMSFDAISIDISATGISLAVKSGLGNLVSQDVIVSTLSFKLHGNVVRQKIDNDICILSIKMTPFKD